MARKKPTPEQREREAQSGLSTAVGMLMGAWIFSRDGWSAVVFVVAILVAYTCWQIWKSTDPADPFSAGVRGVEEKKAAAPQHIEEEGL